MIHFFSSKSKKLLSFLPRLQCLSPLHRWHYLFNSHNQFSFLLFFWPCLADIKNVRHVCSRKLKKRGEYLFNLSILLALTSLMFVWESHLNHMQLSGCFIFTKLIDIWFIESWMKQTKNNGQQCTNKWANWHTFFTSLKPIF